MRDSAGRREVIETLRRSLSYDHLAGLAKCRAFFDAAESTDECWSRTRSPASLMVNDANHCKVMHDTYGYHAGDAVLRHLSSPLRSSPPLRGLAHEGLCCTLRRREILGVAAEH